MLTNIWTYKNISHFHKYYHQNWLWWCCSIYNNIKILFLFLKIHNTLMVYVQCLVKYFRSSFTPIFESQNKHTCNWIKVVESITEFGIGCSSTLSIKRKLGISHETLKTGINMLKGNSHRFRWNFMSFLILTVLYYGISISNMDSRSLSYTRDIALGNIPNVNKTRALLLLIQFKNR
jgi:hypothetical protein